MRAFKLMIALFAVAAVQAHAGVTGFVDAQYRWHNTPASSNNFTSFDGAVWVTKEMGKGKAVLDLPWTINNGAVAFNGGKAQAYVNYGYDCGLDWTLGQFDSPLGVEANDSVNFNFSQQGLTYGVSPVAHQGLMLNYANNGFSVKVAAANPNLLARTTGSAAVGTGGIANLEYFGQLKYAQGNYWGAFGYLMHKNAVSTLTGSYIGLQAGMKMDQLSVDAAVGLIKSSITGASTQSGTAILLNANYKVNNTWNVSLRPEMLSKAQGMYGAAALPNDSVIQVTVGPQANMTDDLKVKFDYTFNSTKAVSGGTSVTTHQIGVAAVHKL